MSSSRRPRSIIFRPRCVSLLILIAAMVPACSSDRSENASETEQEAIEAPSDTTPEDEPEDAIPRFKITSEEWKKEGDAITVSFAIKNVGTAAGPADCVMTVLYKGPTYAQDNFRTDPVEVGETAAFSRTLPTSSTSGTKMSGKVVECSGVITQ